MYDDETGHSQWIESTVAQFEGRLVRYASQITGDVHSARDVVQDTFMRLCRQERSQIDGQLAAWLFTVCRNRAYELIRKEKRMTAISEDQAAAQPSREPDQRAVTETRDTTDLVEQLVKNLSENQQDVMRLKFQSELTYREISDVTELSVGNVGYLLHTAIQKLRKDLKVDSSDG